MKVAAVNFGNSRITAGLFQDSHLAEKISVDAGNQEEWPGLVEWLDARTSQEPWVAASVNPSIHLAFQDLCGTRLVFLGAEVPLPIRDRTRTPETTGVDRLLSGYAASRLHGTPLIVIDCGTAVTFNRIDERGDFLGGAIAPGLGLSAASLAQGCAQLPRIQPSPDEVPLVGEDTDAAIRSGLVNGYRCMVETMARKFLKLGGKECKVVITGGESVYLAANKTLFPIHDPDLLLKGIALAFENSNDQR